MSDPACHNDRYAGAVAAARAARDDTVMEDRNAETPCLRDADMNTPISCLQDADRDAETPYAFTLINS